MSEPKPAEWYARGLRFECTMCGRCCSGPSGIVEFTEAEGRAMARHLGMPWYEFADRHAFRFEGGWALQEVEGPGGGFDCSLLERDPTTGLALCTVHPYRPAQCRTWPFWPENLRSQGTWRRAAERCEGINRGPLVPLEEIRQARDATPRT